MNAREMHYDFKQKLNAIDSQKYRNLIVPEIDWKLNEAQEVFVKMVANPRIAKRFGFEVNQRTIDDIRTIVVNQKEDTAIVLKSFDTSSFIGELPSDYWFLVKAKVYADKGTCTNKVLSAKEVQHDDETELSPFDRPSFEWRVSNIRFMNQGIRVFTDGSFTAKKLAIDYLKRPSRIHNAQDFTGGTYEALDGKVLTGMANCELPEGVHRDVVDIAVLITTGDLNLSSYQLKQNKLNLTS